MFKVSKLKNKTVFVLVVSLLVSLFLFPVNAVDVNTYDFSNFTEAESMAFVEENNIEIPAKLQRSDHLSEFTRELILQSYKSPDLPFLFNYTPTQEYAEDIREAVKTHLNLSTVSSVNSSTTYTLQHSKVMDQNGNWAVSGGYFNTKWYKYNCYAYSINRAEQPQYYSSGDYIQYQPGNMSGLGSFDDCATIEQLVNIVCEDLTDMGYSNISTYYTIPTIDSSQELICVRMLYDVDYHFMRYDIATDSWYHKPSYTAVLKYNYTPSNSYTWSNEVSYQGVESPASIEYDSSIVFITYSKNQINIGQNSTTSREYIEPQKDVFCELNVSYGGHYDINLKSNYSFKYEIYNDEFDVVYSGTGTSIDKRLTTSGAQKYYLRMNFVSYAQRYYVDVSVSHSHSYDASYKWLSYTQHRSICGCGASTTSGHVVNAGSFVGGNKYATCLLCRGLATIGASMLSINDLPHTANGSYILPNGTIVLAPEDMDGYMNDTLVFITGEIE